MDRLLALIARAKLIVLTEELRNRVKQIPERI